MNLNRTIELTAHENADTATLGTTDSGSTTLEGTAVNDGESTTVSWDVTADKGTYTITATVKVSGADTGDTDTITVTPTTSISLGEHVTALDAGCFEATSSNSDATYTLTVTEVAVTYTAAAAQTEG